MAALTATLLTTALATPASATVTATEPRTAPQGEHRATQRAIDAEVGNGVLGVIAVARKGRDTWTGQAGTADLQSGAPRRSEDRYRVGSITKTFVATVMLQLEAEGRLGLDDTVDRWLPGLVRGNGHDGRQITLRQILGHTSGISSYTEDPDFQRSAFGTDFLRHRYDTWTPRKIVELAMTHRPDFPPGSGWHYSDTNYILAGMVINKATGHSYAQEIERRILRPLRLNATELPGTETRIPKPSGRAYSKLTGTLGGRPEPGSVTYDVTDLNPSLAGAAGEIVATAEDLNRFYRALLLGKLLGPRQLKEMTTTVPVGAGSNVSYGLGLMKLTTPCGDLWGHSGGIQGSSSQTLTTANGEHALSINFNSDWSGTFDHIVEAEFCGT
ncbi:beta-lactamase family protein [Streptomyces sp. LX-29]|uniref:serine hydrolase domain-containing protein n=1 Tax=Streptomyces sp. LX-29 TaxID=2900152 RepID=UPI00240DD24F|nr:serine hydrolase domain-containing protein [Streptomyces sp. LX-29]WFB11244.1 beta-lactamase family protein [Streptomyces sp. LX-29]